MKSKILEAGLCCVDRLNVPRGLEALLETTSDERHIHRAFVLWRDPGCFLAGIAACIDRKDMEQKEGVPMR